jgi:tRNA dimethylallyltransferase
MPSQKLLVMVVGPTAVGKTALSIELAKHFQTEIISADSRQFFRELNIGTAKPSEKELSTVKHYFIDTLSVKEHYNAGKYEKEASVLIEQLFHQHNILVMVGGSGLYINAVCDGFDNIPEIDKSVQKKITELYKREGLPALQEQLRNLDSDYFNGTDLNNPQRIIRALTVCISSGLPYSSFLKGARKSRDYSIVKLGLSMKREQLYDHINTRVDKMMEAGLLNEVEALLPYKQLNALQTVGYKELFSYLDHQYGLERAIALIKQHTRNFAKRQLTWFKKDKSIHWFEPGKSKDIITLMNEKSAWIQTC